MLAMSCLMMKVSSCKVDERNRSQCRMNQTQTLISTGRSSNNVFRFATVVVCQVRWVFLYNKGVIVLHCPSLFSLIVVLLMSLPIDDAIRENSDFEGFPLVWIRRCLASAARGPSAVLLRIESTQDLNSCVRSCTDIRREGVERICIADNGL